MRFADVDQLLNGCSKKLHKAFLMTNNRILEGQNDFINFRPDGKMVLIMPRVEKLDTKPVSALFADKKHVSLLEILNEIQRVANYLDCFNHYSVKSKKVHPKPTNFYAAIMGLGCNLGISKMANVSKGISEDSLSGLVNWHMSLDNLNDANQRILQFFDRLSLAQIHQIDNEKKHTSSDGRKVGVSVESLNANHSFKYFGGGTGISIYTFIDDLNRLFYSTAFSSSEREAAYVVDGLTHSSSITSSVHSTDTHGYTEAVFGMGRNPRK